MNDDKNGAEALLRQLCALLDVERLEDNLFRGESRNIVGRRVFGGQVLGQALVAAGRTVDEQRPVHSLHAYFLRAGDATAPIIFQVERARDGGSFSSRRVVAIQHGRPIFNLSASFHLPEPGHDHQLPAPEVPSADGLDSEWILLRRYRDALPEPYRRLAERRRPIDVRPVRPQHPLQPQQRDSHRDLWLRAPATLPDDPLMHRALLAYASDYHLLSTALLPHGRTIFQGRTQMASLDHAMWFHRPFRIDDWLLYHVETPTTAGARGFCRGSLFDGRGRHVASVTQEGLMRPLDGADRE